MDKPIFTGVGVALVTLFDDDEVVDAKATVDLALRLIDAGMRAIVVAGTTGEAFTLSLDERRELTTMLRTAIPVGSDVALIAGTGAPSSLQAKEFTKAAVEDGADAVLALAPPGSADLDRYYGAVKSVAQDRPVLGYHYPAVSAPGIPVAKLSELPIAGLKDSSGEPERLLQTLHVWDQPLYTGSSALLSYAGPLGCAGAILQLANAEPERCVEAFAGNAASQRAITESHFVARGKFPYGIKELTAERFGTSKVVRLG